MRKSLRVAALITLRPFPALPVNTDGRNNPYPAIFDLPPAPSGNPFFEHLSGQFEVCLRPCSEPFLERRSFENIAGCQNQRTQPHGFSHQAVREEIFLDDPTCSDFGPADVTIRFRDAAFDP